MDNLIETLQSIITKTEGTWSIVLNDLTSDKQWKVNEHALHNAASIIKVPIMATAFSLADQGLLKMSEKVVMEKEDLVGGSGVLQHLTPGVEISMVDLITLMIIQSDNTATNRLIDIVGVENVQQTMTDTGMKKSTFYNKLMIIPAEVKGKNMITAEDMSIMLNKMVQGKISSYYACEQMIKMMKHQQIHYLTKEYPERDDLFIGTAPEWSMASKTGNITGIKHDIGVLYVKGNVMTVSVLSSDCEKEIALEALSEIGLEVFQYLSQ